MIKLLLVVLLSDTYCPGIQAAPTAISADPNETVETSLPKIEQGGRREKIDALNHLEHELARNFNRREGRKVLTEQRRAQLLKTLMKEYRQLKSDDTESAKLKGLLAEIIAARGNTREARDFIFSAIETEPKELRDRILSRLGSLDGVNGEEVYLKVDEWVGRGIISKNSRPGFLARFGKTRALPEILHIVDSTNDREEFFYAAWAAQDAGAVKELSRVFKRAKEFRLDKKFRDGPNGLHWVDTNNLDAYVEQARGQDLLVILELLPSIPTLKSESLINKLLPLLANQDPRIRSSAAKRIADFSDNPRIDYETASLALKRALTNESDPDTIRILEDSLKRLQKKQGWAKKFLDREAEWKKTNQK